MLYGFVIILFSYKVVDLIKGMGFVRVGVIKRVIIFFFLDYF